MRNRSIYISPRFRLFFYSNSTVPVFFRISSSPSHSYIGLRTTRVHAPGFIESDSQDSADLPPTPLCAHPAIILFFCHLDAQKMDQNRIHMPVGFQKKRPKKYPSKSHTALEAPTVLSLPSRSPLSGFVICIAFSPTKGTHLSGYLGLPVPTALPRFFAPVNPTPE